MKKTILLDIDGVLITTPSWRTPDFLDDGFMDFNKKAVLNLDSVLKQTGATIVLTTSHKNKFTVNRWIDILRKRGISAKKIHKVNRTRNISKKRVDEILAWVDSHQNEKYVIIDDDTSLESLPLSIKERWVKTLPLVGFDERAMHDAVYILNHR